MNLESILNELTEGETKKVLAGFLHSFTNPAFGSLPKNEIELKVLEMLVELTAIEKEPKEYELVSKLRITRSKARNLIYARELRRSNSQQLDEKVKNLLKKPIVQKKGDSFVMEVENPLVSDHLRAKVQGLGFYTDGSFSPSIIKLGGDAITALIESYLTKEESSNKSGYD